MPESTGSTPRDGEAAHRFLHAGVAGTAVGLWYALPDYVPAGPPRLLAKTAVIVGAGILLTGRAGRARRGQETAREPSTARTQPSDEATSSDRSNTAGTGASRWTAAGAAGLLAGSAAVVVGLNLAIERWIHRFGQRLAERGVSHPHTGIGLVAGSLTVLASLDDTSRRSGGADRPAASGR